VTVEFSFVEYVTILWSIWLFGAGTFAESTQTSVVLFALGGLCFAAHTYFTYKRTWSHGGDST